MRIIIPPKMHEDKKKNDEMREKLMKRGQRGDKLYHHNTTRKMNTRKEKKWKMVTLNLHSPQTNQMVMMSVMPIDNIVQVFGSKREQQFHYLNMK